VSGNYGIPVKSHLKNVPLKNPTPKIAKINTKSPHTNITLNIAGRAESKALTTSFKPSFLLTIHKGHRALNALKDFRLLKALCCPGITMSNMLANTTKKSSWFHPTLRYA
jgi:hypothetical protein